MAEERTQRRLAAILAADVVGYSRLMGISEAGTLAALKTHRRELVDGKITEHQGRIVKLTGDGMLVEFPSVVKAVACAVEIQRKMIERNSDVPQDQRIEFRMGVNLGDIIFEDNDIFGDGVNVAARIESIAKPGGVSVSSSVRDNVGNRLDIDFEDMGEQTLKNIDRPVRVYNVSLGALPPNPATITKASVKDKPSIAVLPFSNMSGDPEQEYFSDGITEDIITELSRLRNLLVIARNSSFAYKGKSVNTGTIARELGVEYILEGSVRRAGQRVRITAQLIDAASGNHVWAERYDRELVDIFAVQDEVTSSIVGTLAIELEDTFLERARHKHPENLEAYDHWLRGKRLVFWMGNKTLEARRHFESAIAVDPSFSRAHSGLALAYQMEAFQFPLPNDRQAALEKALQHAHKALVLDENNHQAHLAVAYNYLYSADYDQAKKHIERAIKLNPSDGDILANAAYLFTVMGDPEEGVKLGRAALRLNPHHPDWYLAFLSTALFMARHYQEAFATKSRAPEFFVDSLFFGSAILAHMGRLDEAKRSAERAVARLAATPGGALAIAESRVVGLLLENNPFRRQEDRDLFAEGIRSAGVAG
jgi:TolB-like protein/class 3 adenylate cyclase